MMCNLVRGHLFLFPGQFQLQAADEVTDGGDSDSSPDHPGGQRGLGLRVCDRVRHGLRGGRLS